MQSRKAFIGFAASEGGFAPNALRPGFNPFISAHPPILRLAPPCRGCAPSGDTDVL